MSFDGCDEPTATVCAVGLEGELRSQPGRWTPRPPLADRRPTEFLITHPASWFFLRLLLPASLRAHPVRPELFHLPPYAAAVPAKWLQTREGLVFSLSPAGSRLPNELMSLGERDGWRPVGFQPSEEVLVVSLVAFPMPFRVWTVVSERSLARLTAAPKDGHHGTAPLLVRLLDLRERVWAERFDQILGVQQKRLPTPGELLGWLDFRDRSLLVRKLLARLGWRRFRALFYEFRPDLRPPVAPDPSTSLPLLWDACPPLVREGWRYWRLFPADYPGTLADRHRDLWMDLDESPDWWDGFGENGVRMLQALVRQPLRRWYAAQAQALAPDEESLRRAALALGANEHFFLLRWFSYREAAAIFWGQRGWRHFRASVSARAERILRAEWEALDRALAQGRLDWRDVWRARLKWRRFLEGLAIADSRKKP